MPAPPPATGGRRITWADVPADVTAGIERILGGVVVEAISQPGGFSAGLAARLRLADGRRVFVKAVSSLVDPDAARFHRREILVSQRLPAAAPVPRLRHDYDDGTWVALVFEDIDGSLPAQPWRPDELRRVLDATTDLAQVLTPSPIPATALARPRLGGWAALAAGRAAAGRAAAGRTASERGAASLESLSPWAARRLADLVALERRAAHLLAGDTLLHGDLYAFNVMLTPSRVYIVDWPHAWVGAPYCDLLTLLASAPLSGLDPQPYVDRHPLLGGLDRDRIDAFLAAHAGFLMRLAVTAGPATDRNLLAMAVALGRSSLHWLRTRLERP
jgi:hypothetical protein